MNIMYMLSFCLTIVFPDVGNFVWPASISFGSVAT